MPDIVASALIARTWVTVRLPPATADAPPLGHTGLVDGVELIGGPEKRAIVIDPYDPAWLATFEEHLGRIEDALGSVASRVDHIGSTAVPGLAAKPIID